MRVLVAAALLSACFCSSDKALVSKATAAHMYWEDRYEKKCVAVKSGDIGQCRACQSTLNEARGTVTLANAVYKVGPLPEEERAEVKGVPAAFQKDCP